MAKIINVTTEVQIPQVPNYLHSAAGLLPIEDIAEDGLREIGKMWTEELIEHAKKRRKGGDGN